MTVRTQLKAGGNWSNHNQVLRVRSVVRASGLTENHNESLRGAADYNAGDIDVVFPDRHPGDSGVRRAGQRGIA